MKTPFSWKLTACVCAVLLAACGSGSAPKDLPIGAAASGGSSSSSGTSTTSTDTTTTSSTTTTIPYERAQFDKSETFDNNFGWGGVATQQPHLRNTKHVTSGGQLDKVVVDGQEIMLMKVAQTPRLNVLTQGAPSKAKDPITDEEYILYSADSVVQSSRGGYSYTWFGVVNKVREDIQPTNKAESIDTMIAHGKLTEDMPSSGKASYTGHAIYYGNGTTNAMFDPNKSVGTTQFNVDYGAKTITGTIKDDAKLLQDIHLEGKISGNSFAGTKTNNYNGGKTDVEVNGRFFGPQAAEMGGVFNSKNTDDILGAFGAKKAK